MGKCHETYTKKIKDAFRKIDFGTLDGQIVEKVVVDINEEPHSENNNESENEMKWNGNEYESDENW